MDSMEKAVSQVDGAHAATPDRSSASSPTEENAIICPAHTTEKKLMTKVDVRLIPILGLIYFLAFLDRVNIGNALTLGLLKDLKLEGYQVNVALALFFVPYILFEIPSNWLMKRFSPHIWLSGCIIAFGAIMLGQGFVRSYGALIATRFLLGIAEAGIFPGCFYLISFYYKPVEAQRRFTWFWNATGVASAFGSLIASGIATIDDYHGLHSWRWIFIIEGAITIFFGIISYFIIVDFPLSARWLRDDERSFIVARLRVDGISRGKGNVDGDGAIYEDGDNKIDLAGVARFFRTPRNLLGGVIYFFALIPLYSLTYFAPSILHGLGLSAVQTQLHTVPIWVVAVAFSLLVSHLSDRVGRRFPFLVASGLVSVLGLAMLEATQPPPHGRFAVQYAALFLVVMGVYTAGPLIVCWATMNLRGHRDRAVGTAWTIGFGNIGGIIATFTMPPQDAPAYRSGYAICQAGACLGIVTAVVYLVACRSANARLAREGKDARYML